MGMYNAVMGDGHEFERGTVMSRLLGLRKRDFGRFRDAWPENHNGVLVLAFYTRNGGGNRPDYADVTAALQAHPQYVSDSDDDFDPTYATYRFVMPSAAPPYAVEAGFTQEDWDTLLAEMLDSSHEGPIDMSKRWHDAIDAFKSGMPEEVMERIAENVQVFSVTKDGVQEIGFDNLGDHLKE